MTKRLLALALLPLALAGCTAVAAPLPVTPDVPEPTATAEPTTDDDVFYAAVDALKVDFDEWHFRWLDAGCTPEATPIDTPECTTLIATGVGIATEGDALLAARDLEGDLVPVQTGVSYATWRGGQWLEARCDTITSPECVDLTAGVVDDLEYTQEWLQLWSR